jgi:hypothetical protein
MAQATKGTLNTVAMILAFLAIGGFLYWLSMVSEPTEVVVPQEDEVAQAVSLAAFAQAQLPYEGVLIRVDGVEVQSLLGTDGFLFAMPDGSAYPVRLDPSLVSVGSPIEPGSQGMVVGRVQMMTDSIMSAWATDSLFASDEQQEAAAAAGTFILASEVDLAPAGMAETGADSAQGGGQ